MEIVYLAHSSFRIKGKTGSVVADPYDPKMVGLKYPVAEADIVTISHDHADHNYIDGVKGYENVLNGPGEYEINGISIIGLPTFHDEEKGGARGKNTIYIYEVDDMRILHLGDLGHKLSESTISQIGAIDILMIPVGGYYTIDAANAAVVIDSIEPSIVLPMHFFIEGMKSDSFSKITGTDEFLKVTALPVEKAAKLSIKKTDIGEDRKIVLLEAKNS